MSGACRANMVLLYFQIVARAEPLVNKKVKGEIFSFSHYNNYIIVRKIVLPVGSGYRRVSPVFLSLISADASGYCPVISGFHPPDGAHLFHAKRIRVKFCKGSCGSVPEVIPDVGVSEAI